VAENLKKTGFDDESYRQMGFFGVERAVKGSPDLIRIQHQRFGIGTGEKKELRENIRC
jgi:hypothetical protein